MLKKIIITLLFGTLTIAAIGCGIKSNASDVTEDSSTVEITSEYSVNEELDDLGIMTGAWSVSDSATMTDEIQEIFDKAVDGINGATYEPIAFLGSQVVAGTNYCFLCKATVVHPTATPYYTLMYIYEDLDGNVEIADMQDIELGY
ncbi:MAG: hypothetical protein K6G87_03245 [Butyrivibrio sp.]|uniref:hypothetical protein n=1 Tax=Butyrivibrio sp. TaxID=28121 RepID=UPI0025EAF7DD|nr:hypothetical protein [Butyrivibrio sp.]MCR5770235.1 hypothetical protein [Butyrivibrio sp.]